MDEAGEQNAVNKTIGRSFSYETSKLIVYSAAWRNTHVIDYFLIRLIKLDAFVDYYCQPWNQQLTVRLVAVDVTRCGHVSRQGIINIPQI